VAVVIGCLLLLGLTAVTMALLTIWFFAVPACLFEGRTPYDSLRRSRELVSGSFARIAGLILFSLVLFSLVSGVITSIVSAIGFLAVRGIGPLLKNPFAVASLVLGVNYIVSVALSIVAFPLLAILIAKVYCDRIGEHEPSLIGADPDTGEEEDESRFKRMKSRAVAWVALGLIVVSSAVIAFEIHDDLKAEDSVQVTAHRGSSKKAPENTLSAVKQAIKDRADYAEIDVQETSDGKIVLLHDSDLMKVAGANRKIWETTYEELKELDVGSWFSSHYAGERIPTLEQVIDTAKGRIKLNIELKYNGHDKRLAERVVEILTDKDFENECIITSLDYEGLLKVKGLNKKIKTGHIVAKAIGRITDLDVDLLSVESRIATPSLIARAHRIGKQVHVWTVNSTDEMEYFIDLRVDNIITDHPDLLVKVISERAKLSEPERILRKMRNWVR
jgi:glycerophosphoryl diester phosphodiesterase